MIKQAIRDFIVKRTFAAKLRNKGMNTFSNFEILKSIRSSAELKRTEENRPHEVMYFHKVDDPYSHLAIQYIDKLQDSFDNSTVVTGIPFNRVKGGMSVDLDGVIAFLPGSQIDTRQIIKDTKAQISLFFRSR